MRHARIKTHEIAARTGLSPATVSRAINHPELVKTETQDAILKVMEQMGYEVTVPQPAPAPHRILLVNCPKGFNPFYEEVIAGIMASAHSRNCHVVLSYDDLDAEGTGSFVGLIRQAGVSGVILMGQQSSDQLAQIEKLVPLVQCCEFNEEASLPYVSIDDFAAARDAVRYLVSCGRRNIAFLNGPMRFKYARERLKGVKQAAVDLGLTLLPELMVNLPAVDYKMAYTVVNGFLSSRNRPDAVFCASDVFAAAAVNVSRAHQVAVPEELMVVGFDNIALCEVVRPAITSVNQPKQQLGFTAAEMLLERIEDPKIPPRHMLLSTELIIRASSLPGV